MKKLVKIFFIILTTTFIFQANAHLSIRESYPVNGLLHKDIKKSGYIIFSDSIKNANLAYRKIGDLNSTYSNIDNSNNLYIELEVSSVKSNKVYFNIPDLESGFYDIKYIVEPNSDHKNEGLIYFKVDNTNTVITPIIILINTLLFIIVLYIIITLIRKQLKGLK
jgi:hypothetical protein